MFERLVIRQRSSASLGKTPDLGVIAEALLFYSDVRLVTNHALLPAILRAEPPEVLIELLEQGFLKLAYEMDELLILTENTGTPAETHKPVSGFMDRFDLHTLLTTVLQEVYGRSGKARRVANRLAKKIEIIRYDHDFTVEAREDLLDERYVENSIGALLRTYVPEYQGPVHFKTRQHGDKLIVESDILFSDANRLYHQRIPATHSSLSPAYLLAHLLSVKADMHFAARYDSEIAIDDINALIISQHFEQLCNRLRASQESTAAFQDFVFDDARAIAEAVRQGSCRLGDLLPILPRAAKFKEWLRTEAPQQDLVKAYFREAITPTWVDKLPSKAARWILFTGAGLGLDIMGTGGLGTVAGLGLGAADTFLLDKVLKGWKPNQFVDDYLRKLISANSPSGSLGPTPREPKP
jgi:hypothetical protein